MYMAVVHFFHEYLLGIQNLIRENFYEEWKHNNMKYRQSSVPCQIDFKTSEGISDR